MKVLATRSLFWKIFGWFWLAQALLGIVLIGVTTAMLPKPDENHWRDITGHTLLLHARGATTVWERGGKRELSGYLAQLERSARVRAALFDARGKILAGRQLPALSKSLVTKVAAVKMQPGNATAGQRDGEPLLQLQDDMVLGAQVVRGTTGKRYILAAEMPRLQIRVVGAPFSSPIHALLPDTVQPVPGAPTSPDIMTYALPPHAALPPPNSATSPNREGALQGPDGLFMASDLDQGQIKKVRVGWNINSWSYPLRLLALLLTTGVVCYGLAHYLAAPTVTLRRATAQLAEGNLSARVGPAMGRRRDELADLGSDFDRMAQRIESLVQAERRLLGDISHELRSPLARLGVALELARQDAGERAQPSLHRIEMEANCLNELIGQLLTLTQLETGLFEPRAQDVNLTQIVQEVAGNGAFEACARERDVQITQLEPAWMRGVPHLLHSAVENVVRNAVRYTKLGTTVEISARRSSSPEALLLITVRDYGPGVPEEALPLLFQPFYRVDSARDEESGGAGLGLSITERAVRLHGGSVHAENALGGGLQVEIRLPVHQPHDLPENAHP